MDKQRATSYKLHVTSNLKMVVSRVTILLIAFFTTVLAKAQDTTSKKEVVDMATGMRSNGKIYVVVAVLCIILAAFLSTLLIWIKK